MVKKEEKKGKGVIFKVYYNYNDTYIGDSHFYLYLYFLIEKNSDFKYKYFFFQKNKFSLLSHCKVMLNFIV